VIVIIIILRMAAALNPGLKNPGLQELVLATNGAKELVLDLIGLPWMALIALDWMALIALIALDWMALIALIALDWMALIALDWMALIALDCRFKI
jgi:hypothetical protein